VQKTKIVNPETKFDFLGFGTMNGKDENLLKQGMEELCAWKI
jgi:hypothetical protein